MRKRELLERIEKLEKQVADLEGQYVWAWYPIWWRPTFTPLPWPRRNEPIITYGDNTTTAPNSWSTSTYIADGSEQWSYTAGPMLWAVDDVGRHFPVEKAGLTTCGG